MNERAIGAPPAIRTAVVLTHTHPEQTSAALRTALGAARESGCTLVADPEEFEKHGAGADGIEALAELDGRPDVCIVLGGDGTILKALRAYAGTEVPVFGFNFGTIGFLAAVEPDQLEPGLRRALAGEFEVMMLPGLEASIDADPPVALNDVSLIRRPYGRVAELAYSLGDQEVGHVRCDGLVAATPAGSTGYNLANQGRSQMAAKLLRINRTSRSIRLISTMVQSRSVTMPARMHGRRFWLLPIQSFRRRSD